MAYPFNQERRRHPRAPEQLSFRVTHEKQEVVTETHNLSASGVLCCIHQRIPLMTQVETVFLLPQTKGGKQETHKIKAKGVVVRQEKTSDGHKGYDTAIFFTDLSQSSKKILERYIEQSIENRSKSSGKPDAGF